MGAAFGIAALLAHLATSYRYGYFRDELYFIACSKHLSWGYVDQPPLVALAAWFSAPFGYDVVALRALPVLAAAITVWLAARIARELGGGRFAQAIAALVTLLLPAYLLLGNTLTTTSFEPLSWTLLVYALIRLVRTGDGRYWIAAGGAFAFGMYGKYSMLLLAAALLAGFVLTAQRRVLATWWFAAGALAALLLIAPNIVWQAAHGWPFVQVVAGDFAHRHAFNTGLQLEYHSLAQNTAAFLLEQLVYTNPLSVPIWLAGLIALGFSARLRELRFIAVAYAVLLVLAIWLSAKGYYIIGIYAVLLAAGATVLERLLAAVPARAAAVAIFLVLTLPFVPLSLPVLPIDSFIAYSKALHLTGQNGTPARVIQPVYAEEFGWSELAQHVAAVYRGLPPAVRARTGVFADTYADAGALELYGPRYGLPPVISAQNTYYLWGTRGYDGRTLIVVGATQAELVRTFYKHMTLAATYGNPYKWIVEGPTPIYICTDPIAPLAQLWPRLKWYGA
ncbi:MAG TPA: glycosyltransferase family 39 protein [Candidatus Baltobacteraceae bacterium]|nr:glycosyltransferase family 39 protein [Candidatus Baltobacteraceae bacterium]